MSEVYKQAGVDLSAGYQAVKEIKKLAARATRPEVLSAVGGFGDCLQFRWSGTGVRCWFRAPMEWEPN